MSKSKGHVFVQFSYNVPVDTYECDRCGMGGFTKAELLSGKFIPCAGDWRTK